MNLVRSWLGQALRATGAAVVVPVAILLALSLTSVGGGGLAGVGALSQIVSGPEPPGTGVSIDDGDDEISEAVEELAATDPTGGSSGTLDTPNRASTGPDGTAPGAGGGSPGGGGGGGGDGGGGDGGGGTGPGDGGGGSPNQPDNGDDGQDPPPPPPPPRRLVDAVGDTVNDVTSQTPVGPTVEEAIDGLMETCGQLNCP